MDTDVDKWEDLPGFKMSEVDLAYAAGLRQKTEQALLIIALQQTMNFQGARKGLPAEIIEQRNWFSDHCQELKRVTA